MCCGGGFTLVEVLVATVVVALLMTGVYQLFAAGAVSWQREQSQLGTAQEARNFLANLRDELDSLAAPKPLPIDPLAPDTPTSLPAFAAAPDRMTFFTSSGLSDRAIAAGRSHTRVTYQLEQSEGTIIVRRARQFFSGSGPISEQQSAVVLWGVRAIDLAYLAPADPPTRDQPEWLATWESDEALPLAVRVRLTVDAFMGPARPTRRERMELLVPIMVRTEGQSGAN